MKATIYVTCAVLLAVFAGIGLAGESKAVVAGTKAPAFTLKNYDGKEYSLAKALAGHKGAIVMFISTECPVSNGYNERMAKLYDEFSTKGIDILALNANAEESVGDIAKHAKDHGFKFPVLKDQNNVVADLYSAQVTPETYLIDTAGVIRYHGRIDDSRNAQKVSVQDLREAVNALLAGKTITVKETKAIGCGIKRIQD